jgi:hypothetical protein
MDEALVSAEDAVLAWGELLVEVSPLETLWPSPSEMPWQCPSPLERLRHWPLPLLLLLQSQ